MAIGNSMAGSGGGSIGAMTDKEKKKTATTTTATPKTATSGVSYDKNIDYSAAINSAINNEADIYKAAILEQQRNAKIDGEGLNYEKTNLYSAYLPGGSMYGSGVVGSSNFAGGAYGGGNSGWSNPYQDEIDRLLGELNNSQFTYDPNNAQAQALRESYTEAGQQAMENTLAQVSARTGGLASSYAGTAAQQQYNNYMAGMNDALAALEQQAYQNYLTELDSKRANLNLLAGLASQQENSYYNAMNAEMAQQQYKDDLAYRLWQQSMTSQQYKDTLAQQQWENAFAEKQFASGLTSEDREYAYQTAMGILQTGNMPSTEMLNAAGLSSADAQLLANYYKQAMVAATYSGGGSRSYSSGSSSGDDSSGATMSQRMEQLFMDAAMSGMNPETYINQMYSDYGLKKEGLTDEYERWYTETTVSDASFGGTMSSLRGSLGYDMDMADAIVRRNWDTWSGQQKLDAMKVMANYGVTYTP